MSKKAFLCLESGDCFEGVLRGGAAAAGEVVFNTSHSGYEEMSTDPSYFQQIIICTAPMQGNYGVDKNVWESEKIHIKGFISLEIQQSPRDSSWLNCLNENNVPVLTDLDTRGVVLKLRELGTIWGAIVPEVNKQVAMERALSLIEVEKQKPKDWVYEVTCIEPYTIVGDVPSGSKIAVIDFGTKANILRELKKRTGELKVFPSRSSAELIKSWAPDGIMLTNGPGDPSEVQAAVDTVKSLIGYKPIFGICMGHQILSLALGAKTFKLRFGHRGSNHPIKDELLGEVYMTSQNHGYAVKEDSLPPSVKVTHLNLNDKTVSGIFDEANKCLGIQFHPESSPGPNDARSLFDYFLRMIQ